MAKDELIDAHVSISQCKKAATALLTHAKKVAEKKAESELLPGKEENVWLVLSVKKVSPEKKLKPFRIPLVHPVVDPRTSPVCLITKDPQREYKDLITSHNIKFISRVVGVKKLKGKFKPFEARRMLAKENGLFLADERVVPLLPGLLGKIFFDAKKQPIPVNLTKKDLKAELERAVSSTYMHQNQGSCTSVKIGTISQSPSHILDNLKSSLPAIAKHINGGWDNIQSFHVKTNSSVSLPIWSCNLGEGEEARWDAPKAAGEVLGEGWDGIGEDKGSEQSDSEAEEEVPKKKVDSKKGKKRAAEEDKEVPTATKKAKKATVKEVKGDAPSVPDPKPSASRAKLSASEIADSLKPAAKATSPMKEDASSKAKKGKKKAPSPPPASSKDVEAVEEHSPLVTAKKQSKKSEQKPSTAPSDSPAKPVVSAKEAKSKSDLTQQEVKKKLSTTGIEKKKEKVVKKTKSGSAKEGLVGKKAKARI